MISEDSTIQTRLDRHKILVVDDEVGIRRGCERVLKSEGYQVFLADRAQHGLDILRQQPDTELVLVDLRMPGMGGLDFLIQARDIASETAFVVITAYATLEAAVEATKRGAYDFIAKPFTPDNLLRLAKRALERVRLIRERNRLELERRERMLELTTEKGRLHKIVDCMADGVLVCNAEQVLVLYNPAALNILSTTQSFETPLELNKVLDSDQLLQMITDVATMHKRISNEVKLHSESGERWVLANIAPVEDAASGQFLGTVTVLQDITELKRVEQLKAQFINMIAHELRAPLSAVDGFLSVMEKGYVKEKEKQLEIITRSRKRIKALVDLVNDLLEVSRIEAGAVRREILPQEIGSVLNEVVGLMEPLANENRIRLEVITPDPLPPINADREELIRLFNNLVSNAIKYNRQDGSVRITTELNGPYMKISFADTGIGISKEGLSRLFNEFFREKRGEISTIKGTGLGLSIVKSIVDFYHGRIKVESVLEKGSTFTVWLPFVRMGDPV